MFKATMVEQKLKECYRCKLSCSEKIVHALWTKIHSKSLKSSRILHCDKIKKNDAKQGSNNDHLSGAIEKR